MTDPGVVLLLVVIAITVGVLIGLWQRRRR
jgi:uncharacterized protein YneF (UPF0154 family)